MSTKNLQMKLRMTEAEKELFRYLSIESLRTMNAEILFRSLRAISTTEIAAFLNLAEFSEGDIDGLDAIKALFEEKMRTIENDRKAVDVLDGLSSENKAKVKTYIRDLQRLEELEQKK